MSDKNDMVIIDLDRPRMLWYGHKALKTLCAMTGATLETIGEKLQTGTFEDIEKIMYCGLLTDAKSHNETLKLEDMEDILDTVTYSEIIEKMTLALESSLGVSEEKNNQGTVKNQKK
ncbi:MAG: hypothetical protein K0R92_404 [Lachnospiraceae bacterium]|jgi:hypothetical protein|nr:hypothetical protein [Lachnospiraceae bacterium]